MVMARLEDAGFGIRAAHSPSSRDIRDTNAHLDRVAPLPIQIEQFHRALLWPLHRLHRPDLVLLARPTHQQAANPSRRHECCLFPDVLGEGMIRSSGQGHGRHQQKLRLGSCDLIDRIQPVPAAVPRSSPPSQRGPLSHTLCKITTGHHIDWG